MIFVRRMPKRQNSEALENRGGNPVHPITPTLALVLIVAATLRAVSKVLLEHIRGRTLIEIEKLGVQRACALARGSPAWEQPPPVKVVYSLAIDPDEEGDDRPGSATSTASEPRKGESKAIVGGCSRCASGLRR